MRDLALAKPLTIQDCLAWRKETTSHIQRAQLTPPLEGKLVLGAGTEWVQQ